MKKLFYTFLLTILATSFSIAQQFEIIPFAGYQFAGSLNVDQGELNFKNGLTFGGEVNIWVEPDLMASFWYNRNNSELKLNPNENLDPQSFNMGIEYFQAGGIYHPHKGSIRPFATITLGATRFSPEPDELDDNWQFSFAVGGGAKFFLTDNIGVRLQGRFLVPVYITDATLYCQNGTCLVSITAGTIQLQADLTAALIIAL